ncbi:muscular LMNA-interacting protein [Egretta garzetta]|uniref:muscular LMNA-interacting protein n=1 Tax=Egretta garzetta TaxID=188379 RepID=UPI00163C3B23|nr:muscular LMNA-interacting protein [Egretta garzetta]
MLKVGSVPRSCKSLKASTNFSSLSLLFLSPVLPVNWQSVSLGLKVPIKDSIKWLPKSPKLYSGHHWSSQGSRWASSKGKESFHGGNLYKFSSANGKWREGRISPEQEAEELEDPDDEPISKFSGSLFDTDDSMRDQRNTRTALQEKHKSAIKGKTLAGSNTKVQPPVSAASSFPGKSGWIPEELRAVDVPQPPLKTTSQESGTKPLTFTFIPSIGRLPTHFDVVDVSKFLVTIPDEPKDLSNQEINKPNAISDELALKSGARQDCVSAICTDSNRTAFQSLGCNSSKGEMQENDLFKAEFILITDSGDEDEVAAASNNVHLPSNGYGPISAQLLATSHVSPGMGAGKPPGDGHVPGAALSHSTADPQKHQLISTLSTSDHLSSKPPAVRLISPTNQKVVCGAMVNLNQASSLEDSRNNWQSATGFSKQDSSLYFQSASHRSPPSMSKLSSSASNSCYSTPRLYENLQNPSLYTPVCVCKLGDFTTSSMPAKSPSLSPDSPYSAEIQGSSAQPLSPSSSKRLNALSPVPVHIRTHSLSPSPKPLYPPSLFGSSSTICSINEPCTQMSSRGNLAKSGVRSPLPTRLTLLTAILRSGSSQRRPLSPASCPTFSPSSLGSSTLAIDQKSKTTPPTPKKSVSSPPIRPDSPRREEYWLSGWAQHQPLPSKPHPTPRARSLSPNKHLPVGMLSPDSQSPLSSPVSSHRKSVISPGFQSTLPPPCAPAPSSLAHPISPSPEGLPYAASRSRAPQKSQRVHTYSPIFTCRSYPLLSSTSLSGVFSPMLEKHSSPSPSLLHSASSSKSDSSQTSVQEMSVSSPTPPTISKQWSPSRPYSTPPFPQTSNVNSHPLQLNSSLVRTNYRSNSSSTRPEQSATSLVLKCRSPVSDKSPGTLPSRPRELTSPQSFSLPPDHENIKPKQYKIKTSYKAFAAIPTNTLLMEQKALEEPTKTAMVTEGTALDTHSEMCSPAQLRQQTEELCAVIDQVLQDPLTMRRCESSPSFLQMGTESDVGKVSTTLQRAAGRETRYANLYKSAPMVSESQLTKPGVIRPVLVKGKTAQQKEEPYQPNPFKKYLEEIGDQDTEQPSHPIVPIPENETLSSKEVANERGSV